MTDDTVEDKPHQPVRPSRIILIVAIVSMLLNVATIGYLGWYVQDAATKGAERRANICSINEQGFEFFTDLLVQAAVRPDDTPSKISERTLQAQNIKTLLHQKFEACTDPNP